jgi:hypothetical protein
MKPDTLLNICIAVVGFALIFWAAPLSNRYNAWTIRIRERHPNINPPPSPEWRARNTKIMTVIFRVAGGLLLFRVALGLLAGLK